MEDLQNVIVEHEAKKEDPIFRCVRSFFLYVTDGPQVVINVGENVRLRPESVAIHFHAGRLAPLNLPEHMQYEAIRDFRVEQEGRWVMISKGDVIEMEWQEAYPLLRQNLIGPKNFNLFGGTNYETQSVEKFLSEK